MSSIKRWYLEHSGPWILVDECGAGFTIGMFGGGVLKAVSGFRNAPSGMQRRARCSLVAVRQSQKVAGTFAVWGTLFSLSRCTLIKVRGKDDSWNTIISGAVTSSLLVSRRGLSMMASSALVGGVMLTLVDASVQVATCIVNCE